MAGRQVAQVLVSAIDRVAHPRARGKRDSLAFTAHGLPLADQLLANVGVQIAGETEHHAQHVLGDDVGVQAPHVGQHDRMFDQFGEQVMLHAGRGRLDPAKARRGGEQLGRELAEEGRSSGHLAQGFGFVGRVDHLHWAGRFDDSTKPAGINRRVHHQFHGAPSR